MTFDIEEIKNLSVAERLELISQIWDSIGDNPEGGFALTDEQIRIIEKRRKSYLSGSSKGYSWEEVESSILETND